MIQIGKIRKYRCSKNSGFTLIEVVAVLVIIGIVSAVVAVRMSDTSTYDLASQVEVVKTHLRYAQIRAMNTDTVWGISFSGPTPTTYYLFQGVGSTTPVLLPGEDNATVSLAAKKSKLTITPPAGGVVAFDSYGSPSTVTGTTLVPLTADLTITTNSVNITVTKYTGFIP